MTRVPRLPQHAHQRHAAALALSSLIWLAGCGGGGDSAPPPPPPVYGATATVSGLQGTLRLSTQIGADVTVSSEGAVTLGSAVSGTAYAVAVAQQPTGQRCRVTNGSGVLSAPVSNISVRCAVLMTAQKTSFRPGELVQLEGLSPTLLPVALPALVGGGVPATLHAEGSQAVFVVPDLQAGATLLTASLNGRDHEFDLQVAVRARTELTPAAVFDLAVAATLQRLAALEAAATPALRAAAAPLRTQVEAASVQVRAQGTDVQLMAASYLESLDDAAVGGAAVAFPATPTVPGAAPMCPSADQQAAFLVRLRRIEQLSRVHPGQPALAGATQLVQIRSAVDVLAHQLGYLDNECYDIVELFPGLNRPAGLAAGDARARRLSAGSEAPARARPLAQGGLLLLVEHDSTLLLQTNAQGRLPVELHPSARAGQTLLQDGGLAFTLPEALREAWQQWSVDFVRPLDVSRFTLTSLSTDNVDVTSVPAADGALLVTLKYKPGRMPAVAENFEVRLRDGLGRAHSFPLQLALPDYPTMSPAGTFVMNSQGQVLGQLSAFGTVKGLRVVRGPTAGTLSLEPGTGGAFTYTGSLQRTEPDTFTVVAFNDRGDSAPVEYTVAGQRVVIQDVAVQLDAGLTAKLGSPYYRVTIRGMAASDVGAGPLQASTVPNNGLSEDRPITNQCPAWNGRYTYTNNGVSVDYCMRAAGDPEWTSFTTNFYLSGFFFSGDYPLDQRPVPVASINFSYRDTSYCADRANSVKCSTSFATAPRL